MVPINGRPLTADGFGLARLLDRNAEELPDNQEWRELVQNGIDAGAKSIVIDGYDDPTTGHKVLRISDDGEGMTGEGLKAHLTTLLFSGKGRINAVTGNFGVGARIAGLSRNPRGMVYASRRDGQDNCAWLRKFPDGSYGLEEFAVNDPKVISTTIFDPDAGMLPAFIKTSGTAVMLHGHKEGDTWDDVTAYRISKYLRERYYRLPEGVTISVRGLRKVTPIEAHYNSRAASSGLVELDDGLICEWWIFAHSTDGEGQETKTNRGIGAVFQNEVLGFAGAGPQKVARYKRFGLYGKSVLARVAVLVHVPEDRGWRMNQERTEPIRPRGRRLDWDYIGQQFADQLPEEIRELLSTGRDELLDEDLAKLLDPNWQKHVNPTPTRTPHDDGDTTTLADRRRLTKKRPPRPGPPPCRPPGPRDKPEISENPGAQTAKEKRLARVPKWKWVSADEWAFDSMCAVSYIPQDNLVLLQRKHWIYEAHIDLVSTKRAYPRSTIQVAVEKAYGLEMAAKVMHILSMKARGITDSQLEDFLSDEALTSSACGLMAVSLMIDEELKRLVSA